MSTWKKQTDAAPLGDEEIIALYFARDEKAILETERKYQSYLFSLARNLLADPLDREECVSDTYLGAWRAIPPARPRFLKAFLTVILRRLAIKRYRRAEQKSHIPREMMLSLSELDGIITDREAVDAAFDASALGRVISDFVSSLTARRRFIFISRYYLSESIERIAKELSLSRSTVNKELFAIRSLLKDKLESEGYEI